MTTLLSRHLVYAIVAFICAIPAIAQEVVNPETLKKLGEDVELYYQANPSLRPTPAWLASSAAPTCKLPRYPRAGLRQELEGTTVLGFQINADGKANHARIDQSSGWAILDEAALESLSLCAFKPQAAPEWQSVSYKFSLQ